MKKGLSFILPIKIDCNLDACSKIEFIFRQDMNHLGFTYPSEKAKRSPNLENTVDLYWEELESWMFSAGNVYMDTRITFKDSKFNPETAIETFHMDDTLFRLEDPYYFTIDPRGHLIDNRNNDLFDHIKFELINGRLLATI